MTNYFEFGTYYFDIFNAFIFYDCNDTKSKLCSISFSLILVFLYHSQWTEEHSSGGLWMPSIGCQLYKIGYRLQSDQSIIIETSWIIINRSSPIAITVAISQATAIWSSDLHLLQIFCYDRSQYLYLHFSFFKSRCFIFSYSNLPFICTY